MGVQARLVAADLTICTIGSGAIIDKLKSLERRAAPNTIDVGAIKDTYVAEHPGRKKLDITFRAAVETTGVFRSLIGTQVTYTHDLAGTSEVGTGFLFDHDETSGGVDGAQEEGGRIAVHTVNA